MANLREFWINHGGTAALTAALVSSLCLNVYFVAEYRIRPAPKPLAGIVLGASLPELTGTDLTGSPARWDFKSSEPQLVYVFSSNCGWCRRNYENIVALASAARSKYRVVGLAVNGKFDDLQKSLTSKPLPFDILFVDQDKAGDQAFLRATPTTLVVTAAGTIKEAWVGAYDESKIQLIDRYFDVTLPGLTPSAATIVH